MIIKKNNKFDVFIKQEPLEKVQYKGVTASLYFSHQQLEVIHYKLKKNSHFYLSPDDTTALPEFVFVKSGIIRKELEQLQEPQTVLYQEGEYISFDPVTKPVMFTSESEEAELIYVYPGQVFGSYVAAAGKDLNNMASSVELKMGNDLDRITNIRSRAVQLGKQLNLNEVQIQLIHYASQYHNIGKIMYTDDMLMDKRLQEQESEHWKRHPIYAKELLHETENSILLNTGNIIEQCFEYWDGSGYPHRLKENDISIEASIISVSFHFENALEKYQSEDLALEEIKEGSGTLFRPDVVIALSEILKK